MCGDPLGGSGLSALKADVSIFRGCRQMNVAYIHNASFYSSVSIETMRYARALANDHEHRVFSDPDIGSLGNIAGAALLPTIIVRPAPCSLEQANPRD